MKVVGSLLCLILITLSPVMGQSVGLPGQNAIFLPLGKNKASFKVSTIDQVSLEKVKSSLFTKKKDLKRIIGKALNLQQLTLQESDGEFLIEGYNSVSTQYMTFIFQKNNHQEKAILISTYAPFYKIHHQAKVLVIKNKESAKKTSFVKQITDFFISSAIADDLANCSNTDIQCLESWANQQVTSNTQSGEIQTLPQASQIEDISNIDVNTPPQSTPR